MRFKHVLSHIVVAHFAVFGFVQASDFDFLRRTQADQQLGDVGDNDGADHAQDDGDDHGLDLFQYERLEQGVVDVLDAAGIQD